MPGPEPGSGADQLGMAVLGRWPVIRSRTAALPKAVASDPEEPDPTALLVTLNHPDGPLHVATAVTDWEEERAKARAAQTRALADLLADPSLNGPLPVVLAADLNARPGTEELEAITAVLSDTWAQASADDEQFTFHPA
jgi:endonuclease/exonuclease/phosphatase family metal-dependent hydrolase